MKTNKLVMLVAYLEIFHSGKVQSKQAPQPQIRLRSIHKYHFYISSPSIRMEKVVKEVFHGLRRHITTNYNMSSSRSRQVVAIVFTGVEEHLNDFWDTRRESREGAEYEYGCEDTTKSSLWSYITITDG